MMRQAIGYNLLWLICISQDNSSAQAAGARMLLTRASVKDVPLSYVVFGFCGSDAC